MAGGGLNSSVIGDSPSVSPNPHGSSPDPQNSPSKNKNIPVSHRHKRFVLGWLYTEPMTTDETSASPSKTLKKQFSKLDNPFRQSQSNMPWIKSHKQSVANLQRVAMVEAERQKHANSVTSGPAPVSMISMNPDTTNQQ